MSGKWIGGKGDTPRPIKDRKKFAENWDKIFGKKDKKTVDFRSEIGDNSSMNKDKRSDK